MELMNRNRISPRQEAHQLYSSLVLPDATKYIRVLDLERQTSQTKNHLEAGEPAGSELFGNIRVVDLDTHPCYTALSYVWGGEPDDRYMLHCNGATIHLTQNCYTALSCLLACQGKLTIWVDALCINQDDAIEKTEQMRLMGEIYSWATTTYIWLGQGTRRTDQCMDIANQDAGGYMFGTFGIVPCRSIAALRCWMLLVHPLVVLVRPLRSLRRLELDVHVSWLARRWRVLMTDRQLQGKRGTSDVHELEVILSCEWMRRLWTFQELLLSSNPVIVRGQKTLSCDQFLSVLRQRLSGVQVGTATKRWGDLMGTWMNIARPIEWRGRKMRVTSLLDLLLGVPTKTPQDTTFGAQRKAAQQINSAVSLTQLAAGILTILLACLLLAVHNISTLTILIFCTVAGYLVVLPLPTVYSNFWPTSRTNVPFRTDTKPEADVLRTVRSGLGRDPQDRSFAVQGVLQRLGLSSTKVAVDAPVSEIYGAFFSDLFAWKSLNSLIDAGQPCFQGAPSWIPRYDLAAGRQWIGASYAYPTSMSAGSKDSYNARIEGHKLHTTGAVLDEIMYCASEILHETDGQDAERLGRVRVKNMQTFLELVWTVRQECVVSPGLMSLGHSLAEAVLAQHAREVHGLWEQFNKWYRFVSERCSKELSEDGCIKCLAEIRADTSLYEAHSQIIDKLADQRIVFITKGGHLGTSNTFARPGDKIVIIPTVAMPLVLRAVGSGVDTFTVIGPSIIADMMHGGIKQSDLLKSITLI